MDYPDYLRAQAAEFRARAQEVEEAAVARLGAAGIDFSVISSRPPFGLRMLVEPLALRLPMGAFNGAALAAPDLSVLEKRELPPETARDAIAILRARSIGAWVFTSDRWLAEDPAGPYVDKEIRTVQTQPTVVPHLEDHVDGTCKVVGVSRDFEGLTTCEAATRQALGGRASVVRSQLYYLDVTPAGTDKGTLLAGLARRLGVPREEIVTLGDMENDTPMFRNSGFSIAMGNASEAVKRAANAVTLTNDEDGFAEAIDRIVLPRALRTPR